MKANKKHRRRGPAPKYGESVQRYSISITPTQKRDLVRLGAGNLSAGVRIALGLAGPMLLLKK